MSFYQISSTDLRNNSEQLVDLNHKLKSEKDVLVTNEQALMSMWEGDAKESFHREFVRDIGQMEAFSEVISSYCLAMDYIADRYESAESKNLNMANTRTY